VLVCSRRALFGDTEEEETRTRWMAERCCNHAIRGELATAEGGPASSHGRTAEGSFGLESMGEGVVVACAPAEALAVAAAACLVSLQPGHCR